MFDHVTIRVADRAASERFYATVQLSQVYRRELHAKQVRKPALPRQAARELLGPGHPRRNDAACDRHGSSVPFRPRLEYVP